MPRWQPLSRRGTKLTCVDETLFEGVPAHLASIVQRLRGPVTDCASAWFQVCCLFAFRGRSRGAARDARVRTGSDCAGLCLLPYCWG
jgi:hypothetical protein